MREAMHEAGLQTRMIGQFADTHWSALGEVRDEQDQPLNWVWKTWAWETALDQLRDEINAEHTDPQHPSVPRLMDVLFQPKTMVFEPLWTLIPSNKAMLAILWELFPNHPYLLESRFELEHSLTRKGYVAKPIAGRCGHNISVVDGQSGIVSETAGQFEHQSTIYQELFALPNIDGLHVQLCAFTAGGSYAGACARVDRSLIITTDSDLMALRVVGDRTFLNG
jgi:glutathionylspermidine amidase/synthetase